MCHISGCGLHVLTYLLCGSRATVPHHNLIGHPQRESVKDDELLVVLITTNFSECHASDYVAQTPLVVNGTGETPSHCACVYTTHVSMLLVPLVLGFEQTIKVIVRPLEAGWFVLYMHVFCCTSSLLITFCTFAITTHIQLQSFQLLLH